VHPNPRKAFKCRQSCHLRRAKSATFGVEGTAGNAVGADVERRLCYGVGNYCDSALNAIRIFAIGDIGRREVRGRDLTVSTGNLAAHRDYDKIDVKEVRHGG
jgi:hypothetical protein